MFKLIKSTLFVLSVVLAMSSCFKENVVEAPIKMSITFSAGDTGTVDPLGKQSGDAGSTIFSVAKANTNYALEGWYNGDVKITPSEEFTFSGDTLNVKLTEATKGQTYTAKFQLATYKVRFASGDKGMVYPEGIKSGIAGSIVSSLAMPRLNYALEGWYVGDVKLVTGGDIFVGGNGIRMTLTEATKDKTYTAKFEKATYTVTFKSENEKMGKVEGSGGSGVSGDTFSSTAEAEAGYEFVGWYEGSTQVGAEATLSRTLSFTEKGKTYTARFEVSSSNPSFSFTINKSAAAHDNYCLPFKAEGVTGNYDLIVDWGDGTGIQIIKAGSSLSGGINHTYTTIKEYTITITSTEKDFGTEQIPMVSWKNDRIVKSIITPLLNTAKTDFSFVFATCYSLTSIPADLFKYNTEVTNFSSAFEGCFRLVSIPVGLFDKHIAVTDFSLVFAGCSTLTSIPAGLFKYHTKVTNFYGVFWDCYKAIMNANIFCNEATEKTTRFKSVTSKINFENAFLNVGAIFNPEEVRKSVFPRLWNYGYSDAGVTTTECFKRARASNAEEIPIDWQ
ncbi:MAG: InlB B-repeat-containing protein [Phocaeicola sp.]